MQESKTSPRRIRARLNAEAALNLRKSGVTYTEIGRRLGISQSAAYQAVARELDRINRSIAESAEQLRRLELERLDQLQVTLWMQAMNGHMGAVDRIIRIMERRARLAGLDMTDKVSVSAEIATVPSLHELIELIRPRTTSEQDETAQASSPA